MDATGLYDPRGLAVVDGMGGRLLAVADRRNGRVLFFDVGDGVTTGEAAVAVLGAPDFTTRTSTLSADTLTEPVGLVFDAGGQRLFVADRSASRILVYDFSGGLSSGAPAASVLGQTSWVDGTSGTTRRRLSAPYGLAYDEGSQTLWVADSGNDRLLRYNLSSGIPTGAAADLVLGQVSFTTAVPHSGVTRDGFTVTDPRGLVVDPSTRMLWIADAGNHRILAVAAP